ncbi:MAG: hypothetical protein NXI22_16260 [bacterium]|nr:hypothetical protein [bacterium]
MRKKEFSEAVAQMAKSAGLRQISSRHHAGSNWVGICSGICVVLNLDSVRLQIDLSSPDETDDVSDVDSDETEIDSLENSSSSDGSQFRRVKKMGISEEWINQYDEGDTWGFQLFIDKERRQALRPEMMDGLLKALVFDLHDLGAEEHQTCGECQQEATTLGHFDSFSNGSSFIPYCVDCWETIRKTSNGAIRINSPQTMSQGLSFLAIATVIFTAAWGFAQHPAWGVPFALLLVGCVGVGVGIAIATAWFAQGSNLALRLGVSLCVLSATLIGNMLGIKFLLGPAMSWSMLVPAYFQWYFPTHVWQETMFLSGGVIGVVIGFLLLRETERVRVN